MFNSMMARALQQARELQNQVTAAANEAADQMKPQLERSLEKAREMHETLTRQAGESSEVAAKGAEVARAHLDDYLRMGNEALKESAALTRETTLKMVEQSKKIVEAANAAISKKPE